MTTDVKKPKRERVQRLTDWDDARWSNTSARCADDLRLTAVHFRLLQYLGRVNSHYGWCELSQTGLAARWGLARQSVNAAVGELVEWGYVEKRGQDETRLSVCHYRIIVDAPVCETPLGGVSPVDDTPAEGGVSPVDDTSVTQEATPVSPLTTHKEDQRSKTPPLPPAGGDSSDARAESFLAKLRAEHPHDVVVERLIAPLLAARRFSAADALEALRGLRKSAHGLPSPHVDKILELVLALDLKVVKAERVEDAIAAVRKGGLMLVVARGEPQFAAWQRHFEQHEPRQAALMARSDKWQVRNPWPPKSSDNGAAA